MLGIQMEKKKDRRVLRTREAIREAFFTLLEEKPVEKITIRELCDLADINRTSFYDHYLDYPDFLASVEKEFAQNMLTQYDELFVREDYAEETMRKYLQLLRNSRETKLLFSRYGGQGAREIFEKALKERTVPAWLQTETITPVQAEYLFRYIVSGGFAVIQQWYEGGFAQPEEEIRSLLTTMITRGLYAFIRKDHKHV